MKLSSKFWEKLKTSGWEGEWSAGSVNDRQQIPLMHATFLEPAEFAELLAQTPNPDARDEDGWNALHHLAFDAVLLAGIDPAIFHLLMGAGVDINAKDEEGNTPLMVGVECPAAVELFIRVGADPFPENSTGETALGLALNAGTMDSVRLIKSVVDRKNLDEALPKAVPPKSASRI